MIDGKEIAIRTSFGLAAFGIGIGIAAGVWWVIEDPRPVSLAVVGFCFLIVGCMALIVSAAPEKPVMEPPDPHLAALREHVHRRYREMTEGGIDREPNPLWKTNYRSPYERRHDPEPEDKA